MTYNETVEYLYRQLPMFHRIGAAAYKGNLDNIIALTKHLGYPEKKISTIHIAGTNGKGSVSNMLASVLQASGYKTGLFTSPHLKDFRERIRINGNMITEKEVINFVAENKVQFEEIKPSFFEWTTALAFYYFAKENTDVAVIETGLGGRLDSTNIISPLLSIITNISFDHMQFLGDTIEKIAGEKAGIIKENVPVIIGERQNECARVFQEYADKLDAPLTFASDRLVANLVKRTFEGQVFAIHENDSILFENLLLGLHGKYQEKNLPAVLLALRMIQQHFPMIDDLSIVEGLRNITDRTGFKGRWQTLSTQPLTVADIGHNEEGIRYVTEQISAMDYDQLHFVFGMVNDKDPSKVLRLLPKNARYYFCKAALPRSLDEKELKKLGSVYGLNGDSYNSVAEALMEARKNAGEKDFIFIGGSTFVVAEVL